MLEDRLGLAERLKVAVDILGLIAARGAEDLLGGAIQDQQETGLRESLALGVLAPADCGVDLVATEEELTGESPGRSRVSTCLPSRVKALIWFWARDGTQTSGPRGSEASIEMPWALVRLASSFVGPPHFLSSLPSSENS